MNLSPNILNQIKKSKVIEDLQQGVIELDNSSFTNWDGCNLKGIFADALKLQPTRGIAPLVFGSAVHAGLEAYHREGDIENAIALAREDAISGGLPNVQDEKRNLSNLDPLLRGYAVDYSMRIEKFTPLLLGDELIIETPFRLPIFKLALPYKIDSDCSVIREETTYEVYWTGKLDMLSFWSDDNLWVVDHKTTSIMGEKFADDKQRSSQMLGYTWAARKIVESLPDLTVRGVLINAIALRKNGYDYKVFSLPMSDWAVNEWESEMKINLHIIMTNLLNSLQTGVVAPTREHCVTKYGKCPFFDVCDIKPNLRDRMLFDTDYFTVSTWSPLTS